MMEKLIHSSIDVFSGIFLVSIVRQGCCLSPLLFIIFMDKIIRQANIEGNIEVGEVIMKILAYADDLILLMDNIEDLQRGIDSLNVACEEFGMKISVDKTKVMYVGKTKEEEVCSLSGDVVRH